MFKDALAEVPYEKSVLIYKENDKYGIINYQGKKITGAIYDEIESLLYKEGCLVVKQNEKYGIINIKGKKITEIIYDSISADGYYENETKYKNAGFIVGQKQEEGYRYGYINNDGKVLLDIEYNEVQRITEFKSTEGTYLIALKNGQAGVYKNKEQIINHSYEVIDYNKQNELFIVQKNGKSGIFDKNGKEILKLEYDSILITEESIIAQKDEIKYYYDKKGNEVTKKEKQSYSIAENRDYFITVDENEKYGIKNKEGNIVLENEYSYIEYAYNNYFIILKEGDTKVYDAYNREVIVSGYNALQKIEGKKAIQAILGNNSTVDIFNENMKKTYSMPNASLNNYDKYIKLFSKTDRKYFDEKGNIVENTQIFPELDLYAFQKDGKWGFKDKNESIKVQAIYDMVTEINEYGFAGIKLDEKWGIVNLKGTIITQPIYKIEWKEPEFIGKYCKVNLGYGMTYYTKDLENIE